MNIKLSNKFIKLDVVEGILENTSKNTIVEISRTKDSPVENIPANKLIGFNSKYLFNLEQDEFLYARVSNRLNGSVNYLNADVNGSDLGFGEGYDKSEIDEFLKNKVDVVSGKQLSTEDFTTELKTKLTDLDVNSKQEITDFLALKVDKVDGKQLSTEDFTTALKTKLEAVDAHTKAEITELLKAKVDVVAGKSLSENDFTTALKNKLEGIDMATKVDKDGAKVLSTNDFTNDLKTKLEGIDVSTLQPKSDNTLNTSSKELVGAINELLGRLQALEANP